MSTFPPPGSGPEPPEEGVEPSSAVGGGTHTPSDAMTRYDKEKDAYHCSYGIPSPALAVLDPEREIIVRVNRHSFRVVGFSIPNFTEWHAKNGDEEGNFSVNLPEVWPMEQTDTRNSTASW